MRLKLHRSPLDLDSPIVTEETQCSADQYKRSAQQSRARITECPYTHRENGRCHQRAEEATHRNEAASSPGTVGDKVLQVPNRQAANWTLENRA